MSKTTYDAIVVGAGLSGLVCAGYLLKAGMSVLVVEKNRKAGGCCTSFKRAGFHFDSAAHSFGSYRNGGIVKEVLSELGVDKHLSIKRYDPSDIISTQNGLVRFGKDRKRTINDLKKAFPKESTHIDRFFSDVDSIKNFSSLAKLSFGEYLKLYFDDTPIIGTIALPVMGYSSLPPSSLSAIIGIQLFREFILDGGYYPEGGMQAIPDAFVKVIKDNGGTVLLGNGAERILRDKRTVKGVKLENGQQYDSEYVISACDVTHTFTRLIGKRYISKERSNGLNKLKPSLSNFIVHIGLKKEINGVCPKGTNLWHLPYYDIDKMHEFLSRGNFSKAEGFMIRNSPDGKTMMAIVTAPNKNSWKKNPHKVKLEQGFWARILEVVPELEDKFKYKSFATPHTIIKYTGNHLGAAYGWAPSKDQVLAPEMRQKTEYRGLYLTGHWTARGIGIPGVIYVGRDTSKMILRNKGYK